MAGRPRVSDAACRGGGNATPVVLGAFAVLVVGLWLVLQAFGPPAHALGAGDLPVPTVTAPVGDAAGFVRTVGDPPTLSTGTATQTRHLRALQTVAAPVRAARVASGAPQTAARFGGTGQLQLVEALRSLPRAIDPLASIVAPIANRVHRVAARHAAPLATTVAQAPRVVRSVVLPMTGTAKNTVGPTLAHIVRSVVPTVSRVVSDAQVIVGRVMPQALDSRPRAPAPPTYSPPPPPQQPSPHRVPSPSPPPPRVVPPSRRVGTRGLAKVPLRSTAAAPTSVRARPAGARAFAAATPLFSAVSEPRSPAAPIPRAPRVPTSALAPGDVSTGGPSAENGAAGSFAVLPRIIAPTHAGGRRIDPSGAGGLSLFLPLLIERPG